MADATVEETSGASVDFTVRLDRSAPSPVTVDYATSDGTATAGADYTSASGTLTFAAGGDSKTIAVPMLEDSVDEGSETFTMTLSNPSGGNAHLFDAEATGTIENHDPFAAGAHGAVRESGGGARGGAGGGASGGAAGAGLRRPVRGP